VNVTRTLAAAAAVAAACSPALAQNAGLSAPLGGGTTGGAPPAPSAGGPSTAVAPLNVSENYRLDTGDVIRIDVLRHPEVSDTFTLYADAAVRMKRLDAPLSVRGLTCRELATLVHKAYDRPTLFRLRPNAVTVTLVGARVRRIYVSGSAVKGGDYNLLNGWCVSDLVSVVGGVPQPDRVKARVTSPRRPEAVPVDLERALRDRHGPADLPLAEDDTLVIDAPKAKTLFIEGEGPRGAHPIDERFTLKQALVQLGISDSKTEADLTQAIIHRHAVPGDPASPTRDIPINLLAVLNGEAEGDVQDYDTLEIPTSKRFYFMMGEAGGPRKRLMPLDRPTFLLDAMADSGATTGNAKIGDVQIMRPVAGSDRPQVIHVDYGKFFKSKGDPQYNPEIQPGDIVYVPNVKRVDALGAFWNTFGVFGALRSFLPGLR
jgi:protein involved in polysaccharide export with SLBB domain